MIEAHKIVMGKETLSVLKYSYSILLATN